MTIGIAAYGTNAGLAVFRGLRVVEAVGSGCIGGFVSFAAITPEGKLRRFATQRGGGSTLFIDGDRVGSEPPPTIAGAPIAALMSSGPDRPEPLDQFVAGDPTVGLVTGHRFAHRLSDRGLPYNSDVISRIRGGMDVMSAVDAVVSANCEADVGLAAVDIHGHVYARNTERVRTRPDLGSAQREITEPRALVSVLHNAIHPVSGIADLAAEVAMETMVPNRVPDFWIHAVIGTPVVTGEINAVTVDSELRTLEARTTDSGLVHGHQDGAAIYVGSEVLQDNRSLGQTMTEPYVVLDDGVIQSLSGQAELKVGCRRS